MSSPSREISPAAPGATPRVSVCIPVYNGARTIGDTLRSALAQDITDFEIIVCDNASTDATAECVAAFRDSRIRYERSERNIGPVPNFNRCIELARAPYLKILCADDLIYPTCLRRQVEVFEQDASRAIALVACKRDVIDEAGRVRIRNWGMKSSGRVPGAKAVRRCMRSGGNIFGEPEAVLMRTETVRKLGGFNPAYGFTLDIDLWYRLLATGDLYFIPEALCAFRVSPQSWSSGLASRQAEECRIFWEDYARAGYPVADADIRKGCRNAFIQAYLRRIFYVWLRLTTPKIATP